MSPATEKLNAYQLRRTKLHNMLDESGIGHDVFERIGDRSKKIAEFSVNVNQRAMSQLTYNLVHNLPLGVLNHAEAHCVNHAILHGAISAISELIKWDINDALRVAADLLDDVNAHDEADKVRQMQC